jgi:hypothetical protein
VPGADAGHGRRVACAPSIFVRQHDGDGGLRVVHVERAASGDEFYKAGGAVVVADVKRDGHPRTGFTGKGHMSLTTSITGFLGTR